MTTENLVLKETSKPPLASWETLAIHLILFPKSPAIKSDRNWWNEITGQEPEKTERKAGEFKAAGDYNGVRIQVISSHQKLTIASSPIPDLDNPEKLDTLPTADKAIKNFVETIKPWLAAKCPDILRVGLFGKVIYFTSDHDTGYKTLDALLPDVNVRTDTSDFTYRVNRRRKTAIAVNDLYINRLATWAFSKIIVTRTEMANIIQTQAMAELLGCLVDFDINTPEDRTEPLPKLILSELLDELASIACDVVENGDIHR